LVVLAAEAILMITMALCLLITPRAAAQPVGIVLLLLALVVLGLFIFREDAIYPLMSVLGVCDVCERKKA
jgi:hypothetical protein